MRFRVDLLPAEYKSFRRPTLVFAVGFFVIVFSAVAIFTMVRTNTRTLGELDARRLEKVRAIDALRTECNATIAGFPVPRAEQLKNRIEFINANLSTPGTSWVAFLSAFEQTVPERVWISRLDDAGNGTWRAKGEAGSVLDLMQFIKRLQESGAFDEVFPLNHSSLTRDEQRVTTFAVTFHFKGLPQP